MKIQQALGAGATFFVGCILAVGGADLVPGVITAFLLAAPAMAVAVPLSVLKPLERILVAMATAAIINAGVAEAMLATDKWSIRGGVAAVGVISAAVWLTISAISTSVKTADTKRVSVEIPEDTTS